jgi:3-(3-hydroxy-phenyl)propionate hydroxylase
MERVQVIVAGAGPVGAVAAYRLAQRGIDVLLLEADASCREDMRASTFHPPTLDMMEELGVLEALDSQGLRAPIYQYRNRRTGEVLAFDLTEIADVTPHPYRLQCEQYKLSRLLTRLLPESGHGRVLFSHRLIHAEQDESGVTVHAETPFKIETFKADYLIGADGANSLVRKWLGVGFEGFTYPEKFVTLSTACPLENHFAGLDYVNYVADPEEWCVLLRVPMWWRVLVPAKENEDDGHLLSDAKKDEIFDHLIGNGASVETYHRTIYRVHQRVAAQYRVNRIILAGDAAHLNNPLGGFGMNSGVHDAWNLTDKLFAILQDKADPDSLLDRYDRQRRTVMHEFVQAQTIRNKAAMESRDGQEKFQKDLEGILANDEKRRDYLLTQAMYKSLERADSIM